jgi:hypothetical protein
VDLGRGVPGTKTAAAERTVTLLPALRDELLTHAAACGERRPDALVLGTRTGAKQSPTNVRRRVMAKAVDAQTRNWPSARPRSCRSG